jgi:exonuclease SbcC
MTVGATGVAGEPALDGAARHFYSERSYLDQVSLGRLLELYQHSERNTETSLARFVNELLGLDQLDALIAGLADVGDVRNLRKLVDEFREAEARAVDLQHQIEETVARRGQLLAAISRQAEELGAHLRVLDLPIDDLRTQRGVAAAARSVAALRLGLDLDRLRTASDELNRIGGEIDGLKRRPTHGPIVAAQERLATTEAALRRWNDEQTTELFSLLDEAASLGIDTGEPRAAVGDRLSMAHTGATDAILSLERTVEAGANLADRIEALDQQVATLRLTAAATDASIAEAQETAGTLATGLAAVRDHITGETCPVCDRDYSELPGGSLRAHIDAKIDAISAQGEELRRLRARRDDVARDLGAALATRDESTRRGPAVATVEAAIAQLPQVRDLAQRLLGALAVASEGNLLARDARAAAVTILEHDAVRRDEQDIRDRLTRLAQASGIEPPPETDLVGDFWSRIRDQAVAEHATAMRAEESCRAVELLTSEMDAGLAELSRLAATLTELSDEKLLVDEALRLVDERRSEAKSLRTLAASTRAEIVARVFDERLNQVWRDVFVRLAPREPFVPSFGAPQATRNGIAFSLQTTHRNGTPAGAPETMLSAGNLNTAALSLFVALHLAVRPEVPCLVFDDPVQSMDEVHVSQFAALLRLLSKQHQRQILVAVHERELFEYLRLELSPSFEGDELMTIELGRDTDDSPSIRSQRTRWEADSAIAI